MVARFSGPSRFFRPALLAALPSVLVCALAFAACANGAGLDDDDDTGSDAGTSSGGGSSGSQTSSSSGGSSGGSSGQAGGSSSSSGAQAECGALVINEVSGGSEDWVEIYNPGDCDVDLGNVSLVYRAGTGQSDLSLYAGGSGSLGSGEYFVIGASSFSPKDAPFASGTSLSQTNGQLALKDGSSKLDEVGYGAADGTYGEGSNAGSPGADGSIARIPNGVDTDDNSSDFSVESSPTPGAAND